ADRGGEGPGVLDDGVRRRRGLRVRPRVRAGRAARRLRPGVVRPLSTQFGFRAAYGSLRTRPEPSGAGIGHDGWVQANGYHLTSGGSATAHRHPMDPDPVRSTKAMAVLALGVIALPLALVVAGAVPA